MVVLSTVWPLLCSFSIPSSYLLIFFHRGSISNKSITIMHNQPMHAPTATTANCHHAITIITIITIMISAEGWSIVYYVVTFCKSLLLFTVIILIGTGWSLVKPFLNDREKQIILIVGVLQVLVDGSGVRGW
jgi:hypothetical protein